MFGICINDLLQFIILVTVIYNNHHAKCKISMHFLLSQTTKLSSSYEIWLNTRNATFLSCLILAVFVLEYWDIKWSFICPYIQQTIVTWEKVNGKQHLHSEKLENT